MAQFTYENMMAAQAVANEFGPIAAREFLDELGITPSDIVMAKDFVTAVETELVLYKPTDKGRFGKNNEVMERVISWLEGGRKYARWGEFHARRHGLADIGRRTESKCGAGDWLYSRTASTWDGIIAQYRHRKTEILWNTAEFRIRCTWEELLDYLEQYNGKGLSTWFKSKVVYKAMISESCVQMQEFKTSSKKLAYLKNCPYCE